MAVVAKRVRRPLEKLLESNAKDLTKLYQMFAERLDERVKGFERAVDSGEPLTYSLNYYRSLRDSFKREYAILKGDIQQFKNSNYEDIYSAGQQDAIKDLFEAKKIEAVIQPSFGAFHRRSLEILANELYTNKNLDATVGRRYDDIFRRIGLEAASGVVSGEDTWRQAMRKEIDALNKYGLDSFTDKSGRKWGLRAYAEMVSRTVPMHVMNTGKLNEFLEYGEDLIIISEFEPTCPLCRPWGGQILSISGATKGYPSYAEAEDAGLFHPSCRHSFSLIPFGMQTATKEEESRDVASLEDDDKNEAPVASEEVKRLIADTLHKSEMSIKNLDHENCVIISRNGKVLHTEIGGSNSVSPPAHLIKDNIFTHNHPSGGCAFSLEDIKSIVDLDGYEMRAVTSDGRFVSLAKGSGEVNKDIAQDFKNEVPSGVKLFLSADKEAIRTYGRGRTHKNVMDEMENIVNEWLRKNTQKYGYIFTEGEI